MLVGIISWVLMKLDVIMDIVKFDIVLVYGDIIMMFVVSVSVFYY